jgi:hypothetical protein
MSEESRNTVKGLRDSEITESVEALENVHFAIIRGYLKATGLSGRSDP